MDDPLRPISTLELLDRTLSLYRRNFVKFAGLSIVGPVATFAYRLRYGGGTVALLRLHSSTAAPEVLGVLVGIVIVLAGASISSAVVRQNSIWSKNVMSFKFGPDLIGVFSGRERSF